MARLEFDIREHCPAFKAKPSIADEFSPEDFKGSYDSSREEECDVVCLVGGEFVNFATDAERMVQIIGDVVIECEGGCAHQPDGFREVVRRKIS